MKPNYTQRRIASAVFLLFAAATPLALGQTGIPRPYPTPYPNPYYGGGGYYPGAVGGALQGQAAVINANGELLIQQEQARIERQKANQAKLDTQKKSFEQMMWEKGNTPTLTEDLKYQSGLQLARLMTSPEPAEITTGKTLNAMLSQIRTLGNQGAYGPPIQLNPELLRQINVTVGKGHSSVGMLTAPKLDWPLCLQGPQQQKINNLLPQLTSQAAMGMLDAKLYRETNIVVSDLNENLRKQFHKEEIDGGEFLEGQRFIESLKSSLTALRSPSGQRMIDGTYSAKGRTVQELANNMTGQGLSFAPGNPGSEAAYYAVNDAFVAYTNAIQAASGFQVQYQPPRTQGFAASK